MRLLTVAVTGLRSRLARWQHRRVETGRWASGTGPRPPGDLARPTLVQPDRTTCGSAVLVMSRMLNDPAYATFVTTGRAPGDVTTAPGSAQDRFRSESLAVHRQTNGVVALGGRIQVPWPRALGTTPWAVAHQLGAGWGVPGSALRVGPGGRERRRCRLGPDPGYSRVRAPVPLFVGDDLSPRHVVLVTGTGDRGLVAYEPGSGAWRTVSRDAFAAGTLDLAGWDRAWCAVMPTLQPESRTPA